MLINLQRKTWLNALGLSVSLALFASASAMADNYEFPSLEGTLKCSNDCGWRTAYWSDFEKPEYLVVYFHGMDSHEFEPIQLPSQKNCFVTALRKSKLQASVLSICLSPTQSIASCDVNQWIDSPIRKALKLSGASKILIYGGSMGGYRALTYLGLAPKDISPMIKGVIAALAPDNLSQLAKESSAKEVRDTVEKVLATDKPQKLSIQETLPELANKPNIFIISATGDTVVPPVMQSRLASYFLKNGFPTKVIETPGNHAIPKPYYVAQGLLYLAGKEESLNHPTP